jgi:hypothetical protein
MSDGPKKSGFEFGAFHLGVGAIAAVGVVITIYISAQAFAGHGEHQDMVDSFAGQDAPYKELKATWDADLAKKGEGRIPIELAMEIVKNELRSDPAASAVPSVGAHNKPTIDPQWGFPGGKDSIKLQAPPPAPDEGTEPGKEGDDAKKDDAKKDDSTPAPAKPAPATPAPATPAPAPAPQ